MIHKLHLAVINMNLIDGNSLDFLFVHWAPVIMQDSELNFRIFHSFFQAFRQVVAFDVECFIIKKTNF
ncbi:hypothetical protein A9G05_23290 [Pseudomonas sp. ENNP23]|nr:hypothetical protein A9G05_23290 [Pseudomonas sp. ENNP23]